ncbi:putative toxin-antitoxin system toxin component, PIN family [Candidatus Desulfarcum epimagneticum]|uniref:Putative toxin-antitoxin system toxin component, PIN family n=1 Tax=uncultured Desulfobacteraceae bacterium TaxID=218296 RepID=A0A484HJY4_9BACT|nr:putative toxin-antitoxin system toxin component, PIN family [uncultured Desulfobacteraceae bacterium]
MKIILDTNVLISGIFFSGPPSRILKEWRNKRFEIALCEKILSEYQRVADELSHKYPQIDTAPIIEWVADHGQLIDTEGVDISVCEDPDDDKFIECAIAGKCDIIVSGDKHLLKLAGYKGVGILKPREFVDRYL